MNYLKWLAVAVCTGFLMACAAPSGEAVKQNPAARIAMRGYSLLPLDEPGWHVIRQSRMQLVMRKAADNPDESYVIQGMLIRIGPFADGDAFVRLVREGQARNINPQRHEKLQHEVEAYPGKGSECARSHLVSKDHGVVRPSGRREPMILELVTLTCAHPSDRRVAVSVGFSQRYDPDHRDPDFDAKAKAVIDSLELTPP